MPLDPVLQHKLDATFESLCTEFAGTIDRQRIRAVMDDSTARLAESSTVADFLPLLAHRFARERLQSIARPEHPTQQTWDVVFVSLSGGGRGQIAAALTTLLSEGRVAVHSAGTAVHGRIDPAVETVIDELGIDTSEAFARPVTDEVLAGADVIVTMGHSVGVIDIPADVRHEDWRVGDPVGAAVAEVRRVEEDVERRVRVLLDELGVPTRPGSSPGVSPAFAG